ncbi:MAG: hypothetical protein IIB94_07970 [Candidatus Marinimicrobia bacterium]|nr:hypothetical protein [Candidatus Neomarinimicrobiota bacterium]
MSFKIGKTLQLIGLIQVLFGLYHGIVEESEINELIAFLMGASFFVVGTLILRKVK